MRRVLVVVLMVVASWAAPAAAQIIDDYPPSTFPTTFAPPTSLSTSVPPTGPTAPTPPGEEGPGEGDLARTGAGNIGPLIQAGIVLLGAGTLLVLVARRRRALRRAATA